MLFGCRAYFVRDYSNTGTRNTHGGRRCCYQRRTIISGHKSKRKHQNRDFFASSSYHLHKMKPPGAPRQPLGEVSPNQRSRVVSAFDHGISFPAISRMESLKDSTCRTIVKNASHQVSCITPPRTGRPLLLTPIDQRAIRRAIVINPKITT